MALSRVRARHGFPKGSSVGGASHPRRPIENHIILLVKMVFSGLFLEWRMKLDLKLIRVILLHIENETIKDFLKNNDELSKWGKEQIVTKQLHRRQSIGYATVMRHIKLLKEGGYIDGLGTRENGEGFITYWLTAAPSLTMSGYSLLESIRTEDFMNRLINYAKEKSVPLTLDTLKVIVSAFIGSMLK